MSEPPHIAYLFSRYPEVSQTFCDTEMLALERRGVRLAVGAVRPPHDSFRHHYLRDLRAPVFHAPPPQVLVFQEQQARKSNLWPESLLEDHLRRFPETRPEERVRDAVFFAQCFQRAGIRHIHAHFAGPAAHTALFIHAMSGIPFSFTAHARDFQVELDPELLRELVQAAAFVVAVSAFSRDVLAEKYPESAGKIQLVYNGIDAGRFRPTPVPAARLQRILSVGRLVEFKGFHHLIRACADLLRRGVDFRCNIVGEGPWRGGLEALVEDLGLRERVFLPGVLPQDTVSEMLRECDVFALACDIEADGASDMLPTVILEAMAAARPVVSTSVGGVPEMVEDGKTGYLVGRGDISGLSSALFRLLADHELRMTFGHAGRVKFEKTFRVEETSAALEALFRNAGAIPPADVPVPENPQPLEGTALVLGTWPGGLDPSMEPGIAAAIKAGTRVWCLAAGDPFTPSLPEIVEHLRFLPDAMTTEGLWLQNPEEARRIEGWRERFDISLPTRVFLDAGREALYLALQMQQNNIRHIHLFGTDTLLVGWILRRLHAVSNSATIDNRPLWSEDVFSTLLDGIPSGRAGYEVKTTNEAFVRDVRLDRREGRLFSFMKKAPTPPGSGFVDQLLEWSA